LEELQFFEKCDFQRSWMLKKNEKQDKDREKAERKVGVANQT
jgi:hypothetical protein